MSNSKRKQEPRVYGNQRKRRPSQWAPIFDGPDDDKAGAPPAQSQPLLAPCVPEDRPLPQKETTMASEPDPADVAKVAEFTGSSHELARRYLKAKNNNVHEATSAIIDNEDISSLEQSRKWDENMFSTDRDGNEVSLHPLGTSPAPTRGPSPVPSLGLSQPTHKSQEDKDLEAAIKLSRQNLDMPFQQESGVVSQSGAETQGKYFGPPTRDHYERDQWAMVRTSAVAQEVVPDIDINGRQNCEGQPRFLKHLPDGDYTPNFITICQSIPAAREAFLLRDDVRDDYGQDSEWWRGHPIPTPRIVHTVDGNPTRADSDAHDELIAEVQRLMAFLESGTRSYATIGGLTQNEAIEANAMSSGSLLELFIKQWTGAARGRSQHADDVERLFTTTLGGNSSTAIKTPEWAVVDLNVETSGDDRISLSELLDEVLWATDPDDKNPPDMYIRDLAEIVVLRLNHVDATASQLGVKVPAAIQLDKYLEENVPVTRPIRQQITQWKGRMQKLENIEKRLKCWPHPTKNSDIETSKLLQYTSGHYSGRDKHGVDPDGSHGGDTTTNTRPPHYPMTAIRLEDVIARIDEKLEVLAQEKEMAREVIAGMSKMGFAEPDVGGVRCRYTLRGVATKPNITYVLRPINDSDERETFFRSEEETTPPDMQWWRLEYEVNGSNVKIDKSKTGDYDVLRAVELEHNAALLVYASTAACSPDLYEPLPLPLQGFARRDNDLFLTELRASKRQAPSPPPPPAYEDYPDVPRESIERSSMDSTRVEPGASSPPALALPDAHSPPGYRDDDAFGSDARYDIGYGVKHVARAEASDPPVAEIKLTPEEGEVVGLARGRESEMVQRRASPALVPDSEDTRMGNAESQDPGSDRTAVRHYDVEME